MPFERSIRLLKHEKVDFAGGLPRDETNQTQFIQSKYPIVVGVKTNVMFLTSNIDWQGVESLVGKRVGATHSFAERIKHIKVKMSEMPKREQIIKMLLKGRIDFYFDDEFDMTQTIENNKSLIKNQAYKIESIAQMKWYMNVPNTDRGRAILKIYDENFEKLHRSGELQKIYANTEFTTPALD